jgi:hypothetical protein
MIRSRLILAAVVGGLVFSGASRVRAAGPASHSQGQSQGLSPAAMQQVQFVELLLLDQSNVINYEDRTIQLQDRTIQRLNNLEQRELTTTNPNQLQRLDQLIQQTGSQISVYQSQINQAKPLLILGQAAVDQATQTLNSMLNNNPGAANLLLRIDTRAAQERQSTQLILNRPPATPSFPG